MLKIRKFAPPIIMLVFLFMPTLEAWAKTRTKEFLTDKEIESIQDARNIDARVELYLRYARSRLKVAEDRLMGKEPEQGDPFEFSLPENLIDAYYEIIKSVMANLDNAYESTNDFVRIKKALGNLKSVTEATASDLEALKKLAEKKQKEELWNSITKAIDITNGAHEGAENSLSKKFPSENNRPPSGSKKN